MSNNNEGYFISNDLAADSPVDGPLGSRPSKGKKYYRKAAHR